MICSMNGIRNRELLEKYSVPVSENTVGMLSIRIFSRVVVPDSFFSGGMAPRRYPVDAEMRLQDPSFLGRNISGAAWVDHLRVADGALCVDTRALLISHCHEGSELTAQFCPWAHRASTE